MGGNVGFGFCVEILKSIRYLLNRRRRVVGFDGQRFEESSIQSQRNVFLEPWHHIPIYQADKLDGQIIETFWKLLGRQGLVVVGGITSAWAFFENILLWLANNITHGLNRQRIILHRYNPMG